MVNKQKFLQKQRRRRQNHVRNRVRGNAERPRLCVHRSLRHLSVQLIDDVSGQTLVSAGTQDKQLRDKISYGGNRDAAQLVGKALAERALQAGIKQVALDRGHYRYHGRLAALADAAREGGLQL
jgi:large subunit ribosomal protein L18